MITMAKLKIEVEETSEWPWEWKVSITAEGLTPKCKLLQDLPDIVTKHVEEIYERTKEKYSHTDKSSI